MKLMYLTIATMVAFAASGAALQSQDLNNAMPLDSVDIRNALHLLGIRTFKFIT